MKSPFKHFLRMSLALLLIIFFYLTIPIKTTYATFWCSYNHDTGACSISIAGGCHCGGTLCNGWQTACGSLTNQCTACLVITTCNLNVWIGEHECDELIGITPVPIPTCPPGEDRCCFPHEEYPDVGSCNSIGGYWCPCGAICCTDDYLCPDEPDPPPTEECTSDDDCIADWANSPGCFDEYKTVMCDHCCRHSEIGEGETCTGTTPGPTFIPQAVFCVGDDPDERTENPASGKIATAIGCIPARSNQEFIKFLLQWGARIAGGIALTLIVVAGIMFITSAGDPKRMQAAKELLTAAISGLLLLIFGVFVLEFIGVDILGIPGFGS